MPALLPALLQCQTYLLAPRGVEGTKERLTSEGLKRMESAAPHTPKGSPLYTKGEPHHEGEKPRIETLLGAYLNVSAQ